MTSRLKIILLIALVAPIVYYCYSNPEVILSIYNFPAEYLPLLFSLYLVFNAVNALTISVTINPYTKSTNFWTLYGITQISSLLNYITPFRAASLGSRALYLKKYYGIKPGFTVGLFLLTSLITASLCTMFIVFFINTHNFELEIYKTAAFSVAYLCAFGFLIIWFFTLNKKLNFSFRFRLPSFITDLRDSISRLPAKNVTLLAVLIICQIFLGAWITKLLLDAIGVHTTLIVCLLLNSFGNLALIISLTPGNIGVKELTFIGIGVVLGIPAKPFLAVLLIDRAIQIIVLSAGAVLFIVFGHKTDNSN